jgi:hypothetical protein
MAKKNSLRLLTQCPCTGNPQSPIKNRGHIGYCKSMYKTARRTERARCKALLRLGESDIPPILFSHKFIHTD